LSNATKGFTTQQTSTRPSKTKFSSNTEFANPTNTKSSIKNPEFPNPSNRLGDKKPSIHPDENLPIPNHLVKLKIIGIKEKALLRELEKYLGYSFSMEGQFTVKVIYDGISYSSNNQDMEKEEYNYQQGSLIISVAGEPCIEKGELNIPATDYRGLSKKELEKKLEEKKLTLFRRKLRTIAQRLRFCIPK